MHALDLARKRRAQHHRRSTDQQQTGQNQQCCGPSLPTANLTCQSLMQWIECDRKNQPPRNKPHERRKNTHAHIDQYGDDPYGNEDLREVFGKCFPNLILIEFH
jgi:hypothetical protein